MNRDVLLSTIVVLLLSGFIGTNFIYAPKMREIRRLERALQEEQEYNVLRDDTDLLQKKLDGYEGRLMTKGKEEAELIDAIRGIANETPVRVVSMVPKGIQDRRSKERQELRPISLGVLFEGSYHQLGRFLEKVENSEKLIWIDLVKFGGRSQKTAEPLVHEVIVSTFLRP